MKCIMFILFAVLVLGVNCADLRNRQTMCFTTCTNVFCLSDTHCDFDENGCAGCYREPVTFNITVTITGKREEEDKRQLMCPMIGCANPCANGYVLQANGCPSCTCIA